MLVNFFHVLKDTGVPVTPRELLDLLEAMEQRLAFGDMDDFYSLSRAILVKDEKYYDRFDRAFGLHFQDLEALDDVIEAMIPDDWLRSEFMKQLSDEDKAKIESLGGLEELIEQFKERLEEQKKRHSGGNKWIGTEGTSPFGNDGYHPEGIRVGGESKNKRAVKVWDRRDFKNLDDGVELGTRNIKIAMRRLRKFARTGATEELDLDDTITNDQRTSLSKLIEWCVHRNGVVTLNRWHGKFGLHERSHARSKFQNLVLGTFQNVHLVCVERIVRLCNGNRKRYDTRGNNHIHRLVLTVRFRDDRVVSSILGGYAKFTLRRARRLGNFDLHNTFVNFVLTCSSVVAITTRTDLSLTGSLTAAHQRTA